MASLKQSSSMVSSEPVETANAFDEALESFQETCHRKSRDGRQTELIQKLSEGCEGAEVRGGSDETIKEYSLSLWKDERLPIVHYTIVTPTEMTRNIVNGRVAEQVKEHMGDNEHIVCPDKGGVLKSRNHSFFIVSLKALCYLLQQCFSKDEKAKEHLSVVYKASMAVCSSTEQMTPTARLCVRVLENSYIQCKASDQDLAENDNWKQLESSLKEYFRKKVKDDTLRNLRRAQQSLLSASRKISRSNRRRGTGTNPPEHAAPLHSTGGSGTKRQRPSDLVDDQEPRDSACLVQSRSGGDGTGDTSAARGDNIFDVSLDSILQPLYQENFILGSNGRDGLLECDVLQNSTPGAPLLVNNNQDGFFLGSYDPFAEENPFRFDNDENRSL